MRGMDCWSSAYENSQGLAGLTDTLRNLEEQYPHAKDWFDELNADNLKKEIEARLVAFTESNKLTKKMTNKLTEQNSILTKYYVTLGGLDVDSEAWIAQNATIDALVVEIDTLQKNLNTENEKYAIMDLEDATDAETLNKTEMKQLEVILQDRKAEAAWETTEITRFQAIFDGEGSQEDKDAAKENLKAA